MILGLGMLVPIVADAQVIVEDPFTDLGTTLGTDPLDVRWFTSDGSPNNQLTVVDDPLLDPVSPNGVANFLIANPAATAKDDYLFFALPETVSLPVGKSIQVTLNLRFHGGPPRADASRTGIALGYRSPAASNAPWGDPSNREYAFYTSFGNTGLLGSIRKNSGAPFLNGGTTLAPDTASFNVAQAPGDVFFEVARLASDSIRLRYRINGGPIQEAFDTTDLTTEFNRVYLRYRRATTYPLESLRIDNVRVQLLAADVTAIPPQTWHVSPAGSDTNLGEDPAAAFRTINWALQWARPGDTIRIAGGTYREQLAPAHSGTAEAPIVIEAERDAAGQPDEVIINGFDVLTPGANGLGQWTLHAGNIWKIVLPTGYGLSIGRNLVQVNDEMLLPARWPNAVTPLDFDRRHMATATGGGLGAGPGPQAPYAGDNFYDGHYLDPALSTFPAGHWAGAHIDLCAGHNWWPKTGVVTGNTGTQIDFRYQHATNWSPIIDTPKAADRYTIWGHLNALDSPGEFFLDVNGLNGPARTLYLWLPDGSSPVGKSITVLRRESSLNLLDRSHLIFRDLNVFGGTVTMGKGSRSNQFDGIEVDYGATNRNRLIFGNGDSVRLSGADHVFKNGRVSHSYGRAINLPGERIQVLNTVAHDASSHLLSTFGTIDSLLEYNTAFRGGDTIVDIGARSSVIKFNHVYHGGMRLTDIALMNTWNSGDMQGTEVSYNWAHSNLAPWDLSLSWFGGQGIRLDSGGAPLGCSNILIHHNVIWGTTAQSSLTFWGLGVEMLNYDNGQIRVYHNTVANSLVFGGSGSVGGNDVRNNIARDFNNPTGNLTGLTFSDNLFSTMSVAGNLTGDPGFVSPLNHNFQLGTVSAARNVGNPIAAITETAPENYLGAYNPSAPAWRPGARVRQRDLAALSVRFETDTFGQPQVILVGLPIGRTLPDTFGLLLAGQTPTSWFTRYDFETDQVEGVFRFDSAALPAVSSIAVSLDGVAWATPTVSEISRPQPVLSALTPVTGNSGEFILSGNYLSGPTAPLVPISVTGLIGGDLSQEAIPWSVDTTAWVADGMAPDASDLRILQWDGVTPIRHHLETAANRENTLIWLLASTGQTSNVISFEDRSRFHVSYGDAARTSTDDPTVLTDSFPALGFTQRILHLRAQDLTETVADGTAVSTWQDRSPLNHPVLAPTQLAEPILRHTAMGGLPAVEFDGINDHLDVGAATGLPSGPARFFTVFRNPTPGATKYQRLFSARESLAFLDYQTGHYGIPPNTGGDILPQTTPTINDTNSQSALSGANFRIGRRALQDAENFRGQIAEMIAFSGPLVGDDRTRLLRYLRRKYGIISRPTIQAQPGQLVPQLNLTLGGQPPLWLEREPDGDLRFGLPPYEGVEPFPVTVDLTVELADGQILTRENGFTYTSATTGEPTSRYTLWSLDMPTAQRAPGFIGPDGRANLLRFALGEPAIGEADTPSFHLDLDTSNNDLQLQVQRLRSGFLQDHNYIADRLIYTLETSPDLANWATLPWTTSATETLSTDFERVTLPVADSDTRRFFRLRVTPFSPPFGPP